MELGKNGQVEKVDSMSNSKTFPETGIGKNRCDAGMPEKPNGEEQCAALNWMEMEDGNILSMREKSVSFKGRTGREEN